MGICLYFAGRDRDLHPLTSSYVEGCDLRGQHPVTTHGLVTICSRPFAPDSWLVHVAEIGDVRYQDTSLQPATKQYKHHYIARCADQACVLSTSDRLYPAAILYTRQFVQGQNGQRDGSHGVHVVSISFVERQHIRSFSKHRRRPISRALVLSS
jgi:hypothetical protein